MDLRKIKTLIDLVEQSGISELEVREGEESVRISRNTGPITQYLSAAPAAPAAAPRARTWRTCWMPTASCPAT